MTPGTKSSNFDHFEGPPFSEEYKQTGSDSDNLNSGNKIKWLKKLQYLLEEERRKALTWRLSFSHRDGRS